jgi:hypothetical protein
MSITGMMGAKSAVAWVQSAKVGIEYSEDGSQFDRVRIHLAGV